MFTALCHLITGFQSATWQFDNEVVTISAGAGFQSGPQTWAAHATDGVSLPLSVLLHVTAPFDNTAQVIFRCRACYKRLAARDRCIQGENWWTRRRSSRSMARQSQQAQIQILNQLHCNHRAAIVEQRQVFTIFFKKKKTMEQVLEGPLWEALWPRGFADARGNAELEQNRRERIVLWAFFSSWWSTSQEMVRCWGARRLVCVMTCGQWNQGALSFGASTRYFVEWALSLRLNRRRLKESGGATALEGCWGGPRWDEVLLSI